MKHLNHLIQTMNYKSSRKWGDYYQKYSGSNYKILRQPLSRRILTWVLSSWMTYWTKSVKSVIVSSHQCPITALFVNAVLQEWTITAPGSITVLVTIIKSTFCYFWCMSSLGASTHWVWFWNKGSIAWSRIACCSKILRSWWSLDFRFSWHYYLVYLCWSCFVIRCSASWEIQVRLICFKQREAWKRQRKGLKLRRGPHGKTLKKFLDVILI